MSSVCANFLQSLDLQPHELMTLEQRSKSRQSQNPYEDEELTRSIVYAEYRNEQLSKVQKERIKIAQRRQGQYVASGHACDNDLIMKFHVMPGVVPNLDFNKIMKNREKEIISRPENMALLQTSKKNRKTKNNSRVTGQLPTGKLCLDSTWSPDKEKPTPNQNLYEQNFNQPTNPKKSVTFLIDRTHTSHDFRLNYQDKSFASKKFDIVSNEYKNLVSEKNKEKQREIQKLVGRKYSGRPANTKRGIEQETQNEKQNGDPNAVTLGDLSSSLNKMLLKDKKVIEMNYGKIKEATRILQEA